MIRPILCCLFFQFGIIIHFKRGSQIIWTHSWDLCCSIPMNLMGIRSQSADTLTCSGVTVGKFWFWPKKCGRFVIFGFWGGGSENFWVQVKKPTKNEGFDVYADVANSFEKTTTTLEKTQNFTIIAFDKGKMLKMHTEKWNYGIKLINHMHIVGKYICISVSFSTPVRFINVNFSICFDAHAGLSQVIAKTEIWFGTLLLIAMASFYYVYETRLKW